VRNATPSRLGRPCAVSERGGEVRSTQIAEGRSEAPSPHMLLPAEVIILHTTAGAILPP
jgi:hypothetical protein